MSLSKVLSSFDYIHEMFYFKGHLECAIEPCSAKGGPLPEDDFVDSPEELVC